MADEQEVLVVEDENDLAELLKYNLEKEGYACRTVYDGLSAIEQMQKRKPDLVLLDRMLPGMSGDEVLAHMKRDARLSSTPIIMITAKAEESDQLVGFALGADDYITKPFSMKLVLARVGAMFRRKDPAASESTRLVGGPVQLDLDRYEVQVNGEPVSLTVTEFRLLKTLMQADGRVLTRDRLIEKVMGPGIAVTDRTIDVHITALRRKLNEGAAWVQTVRGVGYTFRPPNSDRL